MVLSGCMQDSRCPSTTVTAGRGPFRDRRDGRLGPPGVLIQSLVMLITGTKTHRVEPDITVFEISGRLNLGNLLQSVEHSIQSLIDSGVRKLVIDFTGLTSIDSSAIGMVISCSGRMDQQGGQMRLAGVQGPVAKVFEMVHMDRIVPLDPDLASACASFSGGAATA